MRTKRNVPSRTRILNFAIFVGTFTRPHTHTVWFTIFVGTLHSHAYIKTVLYVHDRTITVLKFA